MQFFWHIVVCLPKITSALTFFEIFWNFRIQLFKCDMISIANMKCYNLSCSPENCKPQPFLVYFIMDKRPHFIILNYIVMLSWCESRNEMHQLFFFPTNEVWLKRLPYKFYECLVDLSVRDKNEEFLLFVLQCIAGLFLKFDNNHNLYNETFVCFQKLIHSLQYCCCCNLYISLFLP